MSTEITLSSPFILNLAFDLGYASIGWAVFAQEQETNGSLLGCGALSFPSDDCLNKSRRAKRQLRRNILSRARRIKCVDKLLESLDVLTAEQIATLAKSPHPAPWQLAASALRQRKQLNWEELRAVLVWYAHNRGYDGNVLWSRQTEDKEDTKRQQKACDLMEEYGSDTMAETVCAFLRIDSGLKLQKGNNTPKRHFKGEESAFPRKTVQKEVRKILEYHQGCLEGCDEDFVEAICGEGKEAWKAKLCADMGLSRNYYGSLLFGQYKPRFDNRIIGKCPFTGKNVPNKASKAFLDYRLALLIANLRVGEEGEKKRPLKAEECQKLFQQFEEKGRLTKTELKKNLKQLTGQEASNADRMFLTKEMEEALVLEPVKAFINKDKKIKPLWKTLPAAVQKQVESTWAKKWPVSLEQIAAWLQESGEDTRAFLEAAKASWSKQKKQKLDWEAYFQKGLSVDFPKGRAPYASVKLTEAFEAVMEGRHPTAKGECLDSNKKDEAEEKRWEEAMKSGKDSEEALFQKIDGLTNNHLVRHRLKILYRTLKDICKHYADGDKTRIGSICVETTRDLVAFSGMNEKEVAAKLNEEQKGFGDASQELDKAIEAHPGSYERTARLLRKFRLWLEQGKQCPYTGRNIGADEILEEEVDIDHIIPRSLWDTDTLYNQVLTFKEINRRKSGQTAMQFIKEEGGEGDILTPRGYKKHVEGLKPARKGREDKRRCEKRKALLLASEVPEEFTEGALTQTSHINKLSVKPLKAFFRDVEAEKRPKFLPLPGGITAKARGVWGLMGTLAQACPEVVDKETGEVKPKKAIRSITHLHHAVDAVTLAVWTSRYPNDGKLWEALTKKCRKPEDWRCLHKFGLLGYKGQLRYPELPENLKKNIADRLRERRVVQYMPKTMRGLKAKETLWGLRYEKDKDGKLVPQKDEGGRVKLYQKKELKTDKIFQENGKEYIRLSKKEKRRKQERQRRFTKEDSKKPNKLLGLSPPQGQKSKLWDARNHKSKGVIIIEGNWGLALFGTPQTPTHSTIITHCRVFKQLEALKQKYGKAWAILRNGMLIDVAEGTYKGLWRIKSIKDEAKEIKLDLAKPYAVGGVSALSKIDKRLFKDGASLKTLLKSGLTIPSLSYTGHPTRKT